MPLYEYACQGCDRRFEVLQKMGDGASAVSCPTCGGSEVTRELSTFAAATRPGGRPPAPAGCACHPGRSSCP